MNTRGRNRPPAMTPEESRLLDEALPPEDARRLERQIAADPERADAIAAYHSAMALWRDEAERSGTDPDEMADRVLVALEGGERGGPAPIPTWYAVAAMLMVTVGVIGTAVARGQRGAPVLPPAASIESTIIESMVDDQFMLGDYSSPEDR